MKFELNLQLFADPNGWYAGTSTIETTTTDALSPEMKTFYSKDLIEQAGPNLVHQQFAEKVSIGKGNGKKIEWRKFSKFNKATTPLTEGVTPVASTLSVTNVEKTVLQYGDYSYVSDLLKTTAIDPIIVEFTSRHAENAALTLDTLCRNELIAGANHTGCAGGKTNEGALASTDKLTPTEIAKAATQLKKMNAPKFDGAYVAIVHPSVSYDLMTNSDWIDVHKYAEPGNIYNGEIGKLYGVRFVESTEAIISKAGNITEGNEYVAAAANSPDTTPVAWDDTNKKLYFADATFTADALNGKDVNIVDVGESAYTVASAKVVDTGTNWLQLDKNASGLGFSPAATDKVYLKGGGKENCAIYGCIFLGKGAYKTVSLDGNSMEVIVKTDGGTADPLNQRNSIGFKCATATAVTIPDYMYLLWVGSTYSGTDVAN